MPNKTIRHVRKRDRRDVRVARSTRALGRALLDIIGEGNEKAPSVQQIVDRANVGRTTFYAHFSNQDDLLLSTFEQFIEDLDRLLAGSARSSRLFPVEEFLNHLGDARGVIKGLRRRGRLADFRDLFVGSVAARIAKRIPGSVDDKTGGSNRLLTRMLAGALFEMFDWAASQPTHADHALLDRGFHRFANTMLSSRRATRPT